MSRCTCPPAVDVLRGRASDTRPECPLHPTPTFPAGTFLPRIPGPYNFEPIPNLQDPSAVDGSSTAAAAHETARPDREPRS